jgi:hypothetical protein
MILASNCCNTNIEIPAINNTFIPPVKAMIIKAKPIPNIAPKNGIKFENPIIIPNITRTPNNINAYSLKLRKFSSVNKVNGIINNKNNNPSLSIHPPNPTSRTEFLKTENSQTLVKKKGVNPLNIIHIRSKSNH